MLTMIGVISACTIINRDRVTVMQLKLKELSRGQEEIATLLKNDLQ